MSDPKDTQPTAQQRRGFLKGALLAGGAAAVTQSTSATASVLDQDDAKTDVKPETTVKYKETDHIKTYYRLARF